MRGTAIWFLPPSVHAFVPFFAMLTNDDGRPPYTPCADGPHLSCSLGMTDWSNRLQLSPSSFSPYSPPLCRSFSLRKEKSSLILRSLPPLFCPTSLSRASERVFASRSSLRERILVLCMGRKKILRSSGRWNEEISRDTSEEKAPPREGRSPLFPLSCSPFAPARAPSFRCVPYNVPLKICAQKVEWEEMGRDSFKAIMKMTARFSPFRYTERKHAERGAEIESEEVRKEGG